MSILSIKFPNQELNLPILVDGDELNESHHGKIQRTIPIASSLLTGHIYVIVDVAINTNQIYFHIKNNRIIQLEMQNELMMSMNHRTLKIR